MNVTTVAMKSADPFLMVFMVKSSRFTNPILMRGKTKSKIED